MQQTNTSPLSQKPLPFALISLLGGAAVLLGLGLIIFAHYHERAYVLLGLGAAGLIGGIAGAVGAGSKVKTALGYGLIALGIVGVAVGVNYLVDVYGYFTSRHYGEIVLILSAIALVAGIAAALFANPRGGIATLSSIVTLGVIASSGVVGLILGAIYLVIYERQAHAYSLMAAGALCLVGGIACGIIAQRKAKLAV
ncbi:MAG TPA: hypothetical protein VGT44_20500 [Ktedonobacteraceae bacterium]|nr:hypothetical protein [Ktedonobacteraceae bacterium]